MGLCLDIEMEKTERRNKVKSRKNFQTAYVNILVSNMSFQQSCIIFSETKLLMWRPSIFGDLPFSS